MAILYDPQFTVTRSRSNRAPLGCGGMGDSYHGCAADVVIFYKKNMSYGYYHNKYTNQYSDCFNIVILPPNRQVCTFHWAIPMN